MLKVHVSKSEMSESGKMDFLKVLTLNEVFITSSKYDLIDKIFNNELPKANFEQLSNLVDYTLKRLPPQHSIMKISGNTTNKTKSTIRDLYSIYTQQRTEFLCGFVGRYLMKTESNLTTATLSKRSNLTNYDGNNTQYIAYILRFIGLGTKVKLDWNKTKFPDTITNKNNIVGYQELVKIGIETVMETTLHCLSQEMENLEKDTIPIRVLLIKKIKVENQYKTYEDIAEAENIHSITEILNHKSLFEGITTINDNASILADLKDFPDDRYIYKKINQVLGLVAESNSLRSTNQKQWLEKIIVFGMLNNLIHNSIEKISQNRHAFVKRMSGIVTSKEVPALEVFKHLLDIGLYFGNLSFAWEKIGDKLKDAFGKKYIENHTIIQKAINGNDNMINIFGETDIIYNHNSEYYLQSLTMLSKLIYEAIANFEYLKYLGIHNIFTKSFPITISKLTNIEKLLIYDTLMEIFQINSFKMHETQILDIEIFDLSICEV